MAFLAKNQNYLKIETLGIQKNYFCHMKKTIQFSALIIVLFACFSCGQEKTQTVVNEGSTYEQHLAVYKQSKELKDYQTALIALSYMHSLDSSYNDYTDSLIILYTRAGLYSSTVALGEKMLEVYPDKDTIRELVAASNTQIGNYQKGFDDFKLLHEKNQHPSNLYNMAKIKYLLRAPKEAEDLYKRAASDEAAPMEMVEFQTSRGSVQSVPLPAGCYMQLAMIDADAQRYQGAMNYLNKAIKISPGFELAQVTLKQIQDYLADLQKQQTLERLRKQRQQNSSPGGFVPSGIPGN